MGLPNLEGEFGWVTESFHYNKYNLAFDTLNYVLG